MADPRPFPTWDDIPVGRSVTFSHATEKSAKAFAKSVPVLAKVYKLNLRAEVHGTEVQVWRDADG